MFATVSHLKDNIKKIRKILGQTQQVFAENIGVTVAMLKSYEGGKAKPDVVFIDNLSSSTGFTPDELVHEDLSTRQIVEKVEPSHGTSVPNTLSYQRAPKTEADPEKEGIIFVPIYAQAGYAQRISEPVLARQLEKLYIPGLPYRGERFRIFEVEGNSMEPTFKEHYHVLTEKVEPESWGQIKEFYAYVIVTQDDVLLKRIKRSKKENHWVLISDNQDLYEPFIIPIEVVKELWFVKRKMDWEMSPPKRFEIDM
jgi:transcriptional regulator with XRE-family HTH domain